MLFGNLIRHQNLLFPTMLPCFSILIPSQKPAMFDTKKKKKDTRGTTKIYKTEGLAKESEKCTPWTGSNWSMFLWKKRKSSPTAAKQHLFYLELWQLEFLCNSISSLELPRLHPSCWAHLWRTLFSSLRAHFAVGSTGVGFSFKTWVA